MKALVVAIFTRYQCPNPILTVSFSHVLVSYFCSQTDEVLISFYLFFCPLPSYTNLIPLNPSTNTKVYLFACYLLCNQKPGVCFRFFCSKLPYVICVHKTLLGYSTVVGSDESTYPFFSYFNNYLTRDKTSSEIKNIWVQLSNLPETLSYSMCERGMLFLASQRY